MQIKNLRKLGKTELLEIICEQEKKIENLNEKIENLNNKLENREIKIKEAGSIAEASIRKLYDLHKGNTAYFKTSDGLIYTYKLEKIEILNPTEVDNMKNSSYDLTLFTCTIGGKNRYTLRFSRI